MSITTTIPFVDNPSSMLVESYEKFLSSGFITQDTVRERTEQINAGPVPIISKGLPIDKTGVKYDKSIWDSFYKNAYAVGITDDISGKYLAETVLSLDSYTNLTPLYSISQFEEFGLKNIQEYLLYLAYESAAYVTESDNDLERNKFLLNQKIASFTSQQLPRLFCVHIENGTNIHNVIHWCDLISDIKTFDTILEFVQYTRSLRKQGFTSSPYVNMALFQQRIPVSDVLRMRLYDKNVPFIIFALSSGIYTVDDIASEGFHLPQEVVDLIVQMNS